MITPFIKWVGGKTQIIDKVFGLFPKEIRSYHEPFLGGGSILFELINRVERGDIKVNGGMYASDSNAILIGLYKNVQSNVDELIQSLSNLVGLFERSKEGSVVNRGAKTEESGLSSDESFYYYCRYRYNSIQDPSDIEKSALFVFLNKTCFRGLYREGPNGFNVPFGHYTNPTIFNPKTIKNISGKIRNVIFSTDSFEVSCSRIEQTDFVYLDPPYAPVCSTSFVKYGKNGFGLEEHTKLFELCNRMGNKFLLSNAKVKLVIDSFDRSRFIIQEISCKRSINSKNPADTAKEVLISN
jgi:DNA adenine methylase